MPSLGNALQELRKDRSATQLRLEKLDQIISGIESLSGIDTAIPSKTTQPKRIISAASRRKMALAQKARWAGIRKASQPVAGSAPVKRSMSAAARKRISLVQKAHWAKVKGQAAAPKPKRHISAAGKKRIAAAARERWVQFRAAKKKVA
jgi:hypothetical protein